MQAFMLFAHIILAIAIFGSVIWAGRLVAMFKNRPKEEALPALRLANRVERILGPATILVPIFGLGMVFSSDGYYELGQAWVWLSLVAYVAGAALGPGFALKTEDAMIAKLEAARPGATATEVAAEELKRLQIVEVVLWGIILFILVLMVWRPGAPFNINDLAG